MSDFVSLAAMVGLSVNMLLVLFLGKNIGAQEQRIADLEKLAEKTKADGLSVKERLAAALKELIECREREVGKYHE